MLAVQQTQSIPSKLRNKNLRYGVILPSIVSNILSVSFPIALIQLYDRIIPNKSYESLVILTVLLIFIIIFDSTLKYLREQIIKWKEHCKLEKQNLQIINLILSTPVHLLSEISIPKMLDQLSLFKETSEVISMKRAILKVDLIFVVLFSTLLVLISPMLFLCLFSIQVIFFHTCSSLYKHYKRSLICTHAERGKYANFIYNLLSSMHAIKSSGIQRAIAKCEGDDFKKFLVTEQNSKSLILLLYSTIKFFTQLNIISVILLSSMLIIEQKLSMGAMGACILISNKIFQPIMQYFDLQIRSDNINELFNLNMNVKTSNSKHEDNITISNISFENVSLRYPQDSNSIIHEFNFIVETGDIVHVQGGHESGKSTLLKLISGLLEPSSGKINIISHVGKKYPVSSCRPQISYISDELKLFNGTILDNLTFFSPEQAKKAKEICLELGSHSLINNLPNGILSKIGQGEVDVISHGTKQQIIIARALIQNPGIIIIDEACSGVDKAAMHCITTYLRKISPNKIIFIASTNKKFIDITNKTISISANQQHSFTTGTSNA